MTRWVFVGMLAIAEVDGTVIGTDVAIARRLNITLEEFQTALQTLMSIDLKSNNMEYDGKRVIESPTERGYFLTSYEKYRTLQTKEMRREYMKEYMANKRLNQNVNSKANETLHVNSVRQGEGEEEATKKENKKEERSSPNGSDSPKRKLTDLWCLKYQETFKVPYKFEGAKDGKAADSLLSLLIPSETLIDIAVRAWRKSDGFWCKQAASLSGFSSKLNNIRAELGDLKATETKPTYSFDFLDKKQT